MARRGYPLVLVSRGRQSLKDTQESCAPLVPTRSQVIDVQDENQVLGLSKLLADVPNLHAVVNNAGVGEWSPVEATTSESWDRQLNTNLRGPFLVVRETISHFRRQGRGLYVNVASDCSLVGMRDRGAYNASKFGLVGLTTALRAELAVDNVHLSLVYVGKADTYFRDHRPGDRTGALSADKVADAIAFVIETYPSAVIGDMTVLPTGGQVSGPRSFI